SAAPGKSIDDALSESSRTLPDLLLFMNSHPVHRSCGEYTVKSRPALPVNVYRLARHLTKPAFQFRFDQGVSLEHQQHTGASPGITEPVPANSGKNP
ncbi:MAG: hypothetical protein Q8K17_00850, partial [Pseudohongiella sp.]|nr:hypothetical protein [Pseudohongiella sp.]